MSNNDTKKVTVETLKANGEYCVVIDDHRIAGENPWGGEKIVFTEEVKVSEIILAVPSLEKK